MSWSNDRGISKTQKFFTALGMILVASLLAMVVFLLVCGAFEMVTGRLL